MIPIAGTFVTVVPVNAGTLQQPRHFARQQATLEAPDLKTRAETLIAVTEMDLAKKRTSGEPGLQ